MCLNSPQDAPLRLRAAALSEANFPLSHTSRQRCPFDLCVLTPCWSAASQLPLAQKQLVMWADTRKGKQWSKARYIWPEISAYKAMTTEQRCLERTSVFVFRPRKHLSLPVRDGSSWWRWIPNWAEIFVRLPCTTPKINMKTLGEYREGASLRSHAFLQLYKPWHTGKCVRNPWNR